MVLGMQASTVAIPGMARPGAVVCGVWEAVGFAPCLGVYVGVSTGAGRDEMVGVLVGSRGEESQDLGVTVSPPIQATRNSIDTVPTSTKKDFFMRFP